MTSKGRRALGCVELVACGVIVLVLTATAQTQEDCSFVRGNITQEGDPLLVDLNDAVEVPALLFLGNEGSVPSCLDAADANDNGIVELSDYTYLVNFRFDQGPPPPAPYPEEGVDDTAPTIPDEGDSRFAFQFGAGVGVPGNTGISIPLTLTNEIGVTGVTAAFEYNPAEVRIDEMITEEGTLLSQENAEYIVATFDNNRGFGFVGALKDFATPFSFQSGESPELPAGEEQLIATLKCAVVVTADKGFAPISFTNGLRASSTLPEEGRPAIENVVLLGGTAVRPLLLEGGGIEIRRGFIRGDINQDNAVDISDAVFILNHIFKGERGPTCKDAADANNDTRIDLSDAIWMLSFLFRGGPQPSEPFPQPGVDPTDDGSGSLGCGEEEA